MFPVLIRLQQKFLRLLVWCQVFEKVKMYATVKIVFLVVSKKWVAFLVPGLLSSKCYKGANDCL